MPCYEYYVILFLFAVFPYQDGLPVPDASSSHVPYVGWRKFPAEHSSSENHHVFGWRDLMDIAVRFVNLGRQRNIEIEREREREIHQSGKLLSNERQ